MDLLVFFYDNSLYSTGQGAIIGILSVVKYVSSNSSVWNWENNHIVSQLSSSVVSLCDPMDFSTPASLYNTNSRNVLKLMPIELVMPSKHLILYCPLLLLLSIFPSIGGFPSESALLIRWPKYWSFIFNISPSNEYSGLISLGLTGQISLQSKGL